MALQRNRAEVLLFILGLFLLVQLVSELTPPFQSPDEPNHIARAYLLAQGVIFVDEKNNIQGGAIDEGLLDYLSCFNTILWDYTKKRDSAIPLRCQDIHFTHTEKFAEFPNTALYFPLAYSPQAIALAFGEHFDWPVSRTYYFARLLSLLGTLVILMWAFLLYPAPPACMALFVTPICISQLASASLDPVTFALSALVGALFLRGMDKSRMFDGFMHAALACAIFILATSRIIYLPLAMFLMAISWRRRSWQLMVSSLVVTAISLCWIFFVFKTISNEPYQSQRSLTEVAQAYFYHPLILISVFLETFRDAHLLQLHWRSFIGILGMFDTPMDSFVYMLFGALFLSLATVSVVRGSLKSGGVESLVLAIASLVSIFLVFFVELVVFTPYPAKVIIGVQGRYFYPAAIFLAYAVPPQLGLRRKLSVFGIALVAIFAMADVFVKLRLRYG